MSKIITLAVISDLHYRQHENASCRPAVATEPHLDPIAGLFKLIGSHRSELAGGKPSIADYLLCPGDISDKANNVAFGEGWSQLGRLRDALGATALVASTGNHEVDSRAGEEHQAAGNVLHRVDPVGFLQGFADYPTTLIDPPERRWIYWGRGYEIIEQDDLFFLLVNSSHFHVTTQPNEYERGRISNAALQDLREQLNKRIEVNRNRLFIMLLHHHPTDHQNLDVALGPITMDNGTQLMQTLLECQVAWLVVHGHKHFPRLVRHDSDSPGKAVVFGAGSVGTQLGDLATRTRHQFYLIDAQIVDQAIEPTAAGTVRAFSWNGSTWEPSMKVSHGLPAGCGYSIPEISIRDVAVEVERALRGKPYLRWDELAKEVPMLTTIFPQHLSIIRNAFTTHNIACTWPAEDFFPSELSTQKAESK